MPSMRSERPQSFSCRSGSTPGRCFFSSSAGTSAVAGASRSRIDRVVRSRSGIGRRFKQAPRRGVPSTGSSAALSALQSRAPITPSVSTISSFQGWMIVAGTIPSSRALAMFTGLSSTSTWTPSSTQRGTLSNEQWRSSKGMPILSSHAAVAS